MFFGPLRMLDFVKAGDANPWQNILARRAWGAGFVVVFLALLNSVIANLNASTTPPPATCSPWAGSGSCPRAFAALTRRYRSPYVGLWAQLVITVGLSLWLGFQYDPYTAFALTATIIVDVFVPLYILLNVACIAYFLRFRREELNWVLYGLFPVLGIAAFVPAFCAGAGLPVFRFITPLPRPLSYAGPVVGAWVVIGIGYMLYLQGRHPERIIETRRIFVEEEPVAAS